MADFSNLLDLAQLAQAMGKQHVYVAQERCLAVRHRRSRCKDCVDVCPAGAIEVDSNRVTLDQAACIGCTACTTVCPVEALVPLDPPDVAIQAELSALLEAAEEKGLRAGDVCIACARKASRREVDDRSFLEVPCLCRIHESVLVRLASQGAKRVFLVDGNCKSCKLGSCDQVAQMVQENAQKLLGSMGSDVAVERRSSFPEGLTEYQAVALKESRRAFFTTSANEGKNAATKTARFFIKKEAKKDTTVATVLDTLGVSVEEQSKITEPQRATTLIDSLYELGEPVSEELDSRFFGSLELETVRCSMCGICAVVCPTKALRRSASSHKQGERGSFLDYWASDCVQCHLCEDVCFRKCLTVNSNVAFEDLFSFDPQVLG